MSKQPRKLQLKVDLEGEPGKEIEATAFVFDQAGMLVTSAPVRNGKADLALPAEGELQPQIIIGPTTLAEGKPTLERLRRAGGHEPVFTLSPDAKTLQLESIPETDWSPWHQCRCLVRGRVVRPVRFGHGVTDMPVCKAIVHICEVDRWPFVIERIPDLLLERLREEILVGPIPEPDPPPWIIDPGVIDPSPLAIAAAQPRFDKVALNPQPLPPRALEARGIDAGMSHVASFARGAAEAMVAPFKFRGAGPAVNEVTRAALASESLESVRMVLIDQAALFIPYICLWDYLWPWFTCDEVAVVTTDDNGRFAAKVWYPCKGDKPDIYIWVEYPIGGTPTTVYHPTMACNTYWDYQCGRKLTIRVTDPRVPWCGETPRPPGSQVVVVGIGGKLGFTEIHGAASTAPIGLTKGTDADGHGGDRPLGGSIEPSVLFGTALPAAVTHYRWSVRQLTRSADPTFTSEVTWRGLDQPVGRHYEAAATPEWLSLGPDVAATGGSLFLIPPTVAPGGPGSVWRPNLAPRINNASAFFLSHLEAGSNASNGAGTYELKLELFKLVAGVPVRVRWDDPAAPIEPKVVNEPVPVGMTPVPYAPAPAGNRLIEAGQLVGFRWVLRVDNNKCVATIANVVVGANEAGPCGFIAYTPPLGPLAPAATIAFRAYHPNGFATFSFVVTKGSSGSVPEAIASGPVTQMIVNGFTNDGAGNFTKQVPVSVLVGTCPGGQAAFAETNYVSAMATDGWNILSYLDSGLATKAFALEPGTP